MNNIIHYKISNYFGYSVKGDKTIKYRYNLILNENYKYYQIIKC